MPISKPGAATEIAQDGGRKIGRFWELWFDQLLLELYQSLTVPGAITIIDPNIVDISIEFPTVGGPTNGVGRVGGPYQWWALCNGNNNTPDLSTSDIESVFSLRYIMRIT